MGLQRVGHNWATDLNWMYKYGGGILLVRASYWKNPKEPQKELAQKCASLRSNTMELINVIPLYNS